MIKKFRSIHKKLVILITWVLLMVFGAFLSLDITINFFNLKTRLIQIENYHKNHLLSKGKILIANNSQALRGMAEDNAFSAINELVSSTVNEDTDIVYGIYMDNTQKAWVVADSSKIQKKIGTVLTDSVSNWANQVKTASIKEIGNIIEFAAPVICNNEKYGTIRYGLTTSPMQQSIVSAKSDAFRKSLTIPILVLIISLVIFLLGSRIADKKATTIIEPLEKLTNFAETIANGDYSVPINVDTDDEISSLAAALEIMRKTIKEYTETLEEKVSKRTDELIETQKKLVEQAHKSGMADIATAVLHNIGNILNSAVISGEIMKETLEQSHINHFKNANKILRDNFDNLTDFIKNDPKALKLFEYYLILEKIFDDEQNILSSHLDRLMLKNQSIKEVIIAQQSYASSGRAAEEIYLHSIVEDTLKLEEGMLHRHHIQIIKHYNDKETLFLERAKIMQILINLLKNSKEALTNINEKKIIIEINQTKENIILKLTDNGQGIKPENIKKIFTHGFTTKKNGHGLLCA